MAVLEADRITRVFGGEGLSNSTKALNGIDLRVEKGEFVGIMGPSGSGKTTLLNVLSGLLRPTSGEVRINDTVLHALPKDELAVFRRRQLGFVFQDYNMLDSMTLRENIMVPLVLDKKDVREINEKASALLKLLDLVDSQHKYPYQVSGGQLQRTCIGRALITSPTLIFADEPTGNLDSNSSKHVMGYLEKINREQSNTILLVTHDPFSASFCHRIVFIKDGLVNIEIQRKKDRKAFFDKIIDCLAVLGGERNDLE